MNPSLVTENIGLGEVGFGNILVIYYTIVRVSSAMYRMLWATWIRHGPNLGGGAFSALQTH